MGKCSLRLWVRIYDPRIGKFKSRDPLSASYPWYTPYQFAGNKPIWKVDIDGLEEGFWEGAGKQMVEGGKQLFNIVNNPNHAGYGYSPNMKPPTREQIEQYSFNWKTLDPQY